MLRGGFLCAALVAAMIAGFRPAGAQDAVKAFPKNYQLIFENEYVSVIRVHYGPYEKVGVHDHSAFPTVYVYLSDSPPVRFTHDEQPPFVQVRPPAKAGAFRVSPGRRERHSVENLGDGSSDFLRVELKQLPLGSVQAFRGEAPEDLSAPEHKVEVDSPALRIERLFCLGSNANYYMHPASAPSLLVAFTASPIITAMEGIPPSRRPQMLSAGQVSWLDSGMVLQVLPETGVPANLLRISFPEAATTESSIPRRSSNGK